MLSATQTRVRIRVEHDCDVESPCDYDGWKLYSFSTRHRNFKHPDAVIDANGGRLGFNSKLRAGTAFKLGYFEHGRCQWALAGEQWPCPWDSVDFAGLLVWEQPVKDLPKTYDERKKSARLFLEEYTAWCNGDCYWFEIECSTDWYADGVDMSEWVDFDSCGGYIGSDWLIAAVKERLPKDAEIVSVKSDCGFTIDNFTE